MHRVSEIIVDKRGIIFIVVILSMIFSAFSVGWVEVENDLTKFLPDGSSSQIGADVMFEEFTLMGMAQITLKIGKNAVKINTLHIPKKWDYSESFLTITSSIRTIPMN